MMSLAIYFVMYCGLFVIPGVLLLFILGDRRPVSLLAVALSYAVLVLLLNVAQQCGLTVSTFNAILFFLLAGLALVAAATTALRFRLRGKDVIHARFMRLLRPGAMLPFAVLCGAVLLYALFVGPYMELPADVWNHLARFQNAARMLSGGHFSSDAHGLMAWLQQGNHWYLLHAWLCSMADLRLQDSLWILNSLTMFFYCVAQYVLVLTVFARSRLPLRAKHWMAALAAGLSFWSMGYFAFSYARYYAMAPALMNYVSMAGVLCVSIRWLDCRPLNRAALCVLPLIVLQLALVHQTEVMYLIITVWAFALASLAIGRDTVRRRALWVAFGLSALFAMAFVFSQIAWSRDYSCAWMLRALPGLGSSGKSWYVLAPELTFAAVVGPFGALVYMLALVYRKQLVRYPYIVGGLLLPWLGVFNPLTVEMALRHPPAMSGMIMAVLYRINYMIPLNMIAAYLIVWAWQSPPRGTALRALPRRLGIGLCVLIPLLPWSSIYSDAWWDRWPSLKATPPAASYAHWIDLIGFLQSLPPSIVVTDPVTGYMVNGLTRHQAPGKKFYTSILSDIARVDSRSAREKVYELLRKPGAVAQELPGVLIVNERDGQVGEAGRLSRHWPEDVLSVSSCYTPAVRSAIASLAPALRSIWGAERVRVFLIDRPAFDAMLPKVPRLLSAVPDWYYDHTLGPGITLDWTPVRQDSFIAYQVQCRANGGEWFDVATNRSGLYSWIHHFDDPVVLKARGWRGLRKGILYEYRVRARYDQGAADWSNVIGVAIPASFR